jgi:hypothetical protein
MFPFFIRENSSEKAGFMQAFSPFSLYFFREKVPSKKGKKAQTKPTLFLEYHRIKSTHTQA